MVPKITVRLPSGRSTKPVVRQGTRGGPVVQLRVLISLQGKASPRRPPLPGGLHVGVAVVPVAELPAAAVVAEVAEEVVFCALDGGRRQACGLYRGQMPVCLKLLRTNQTSTY